MKNAIRNIIEINKSEPKTAMEVMVKIQEECGELAAEMLRYIGKKGSNGDSKKVLRGKILEEACDIIITCTSVIEKFGFKEEHMAKMINKKCNKWKQNQKKYKEWAKNEYQEAIGIIKAEVNNSYARGYVDSLDEVIEKDGMHGLIIQIKYIRENIKTWRGEKSKEIKEFLDKWIKDKTTKAA